MAVMPGIGAGFMLPLPAGLWGKGKRQEGEGAAKGATLSSGMVQMRLNCQGQSSSTHEPQRGECVYTEALPSPDAISFALAGGMKAQTSQVWIYITAAHGAARRNCQAQFAGKPVMAVMPGIGAGFMLPLPRNPPLALADLVSRAW